MKLQTSNRYLSSQQEAH